MKTSSSVRTAADARTSRRAQISAAFGNTIEWYDFAIYGAFASIITPIFFPDRSASSTLFAAFAVFGTAFIARPFGALFFGRRADARGRRAVLVTVILSMSAATAVIGVLPTYASIGILAPLALVLLRITQGFAAGGELGVATAFLIEHSTRGRRGVTGAWQIGTLAGGVALGFLVASLLTGLSSAEDLDGWWRLAFLLAVPLALIGLFIRQRVAESPGFDELRADGRTTADSAQQVWRHHRRELRAGFLLIAAGAIGFNVFYVFVPNHLIVVDDRSLPSAFVPAIIGLALTAVSSVLLGRLSDRVGRRPVVLTSIVALIVTAIPMYVLADRGDAAGLVVADSVVGVCIGGTLSVAMVAEMFSMPVRAAGIAMTAGLATALLGGTAPLVSQALVTSTGSDVVPGVYLAVAAVIALLAIRTWPETAFDELD